jgi:hypothetical protein
MSRIVIVILIYNRRTNLLIALTCWARSGDVIWLLWGADKPIDIMQFTIDQKVKITWPVSQATASNTVTTWNYDGQAKPGNLQVKLCSLSHPPK